MRVLVLAIGLTLAGPALADGVPAWRAVDAETGRIADTTGLVELASQFPDSGTVRLRLLNAQLEAGDGEGAIASLEWLNRRGYIFSELARGQIPKLVGEALAEGARALLLPLPEPIERSTVLLTVPESAGLVESVLREPMRDRITVTSVSEMAIFTQLDDVRWGRYDLHDASNVSGIAIDASHTIWLTAGRIDGADGEAGEFRGIIGLPNGGGPEIKVRAADGVSLSDIAVGPDGTLYASDPIGGGVYLARSRNGDLEALIPLGTFRSPQGLAVSEDNQMLYVSDYRYGIAIIDLATRQVSRLTTSLPLVLDGIDGLWLYDNELIAVQNGTSPMRISAFELSADGRSIVGYRILEQANPEWTEPLSGSIDGDRLLYVGNGQWDRFVGGEPAQDKPTLPTQIRSLPLAR